MEDYSVNTDPLGDKIEKLSGRRENYNFCLGKRATQRNNRDRRPGKRKFSRGNQKLKEMKIKTVMITGDNKTTAENIARRTGIDAFEAEVLPAG